MGNYYGGIVDLSNCKKLEIIDHIENDTKFKLPSSVIHYGDQNGMIPDFTNCANTITYISMNQNHKNHSLEDMETLCRTISESTSLLTFIYKPTDSDTDFSFLNLLSKSSLQTLEITRNNASMGKFTKMHLIDFRKGETYVEGTKHFENFKCLGIYYATLENLDGFNDCVNLEKVYVTDCMIKNITGLKNLVNLTEINLENNGNITNLRALQGLSKLTYLNLRNNSVYNSIYDLELEGYYDNVALLISLNSAKLSQIFLLNNKLDNDAKIILNNLTWTVKEF